MKKLTLLLAASTALCASAAKPSSDQHLTEGSYSPTWESLAAWECPEWFKDAKFGIWAHWGPQCEAEAGDWYARFMYYPGSGQYNYHVSNYGNPSKFGLKDLCNEWKAENWNPSELVELYKSVGARYFMTLANHHDNFDLWDSPYQEWNSVNIGPKRDIVGEWSKACKDAGLPLGVSVHASHAWTWLESSQRYDGNLTLEDGYLPNADGSEKWWKGYDPQELYAQNHPHSQGWENSGTIHSQWDWGNGCSVPDEAYRKKLMNRTLQLVYDYNPDMIYFDDTALPFYGCDEQWGLDFLSSYYNFSAKANAGNQQVVVTGKQLKPHIKEAMLWDVERGIPDRMQTEYWQTCTCIGDWHYNRSLYNNNGYKSAATVVRMLVDVVSKNGNLLLSIPVRGDGTIDEKERAVLDGIKAWMDINSESIYATRPWKTFGEGPLAEAANPLTAQGFNEGFNYTPDDIRYVQKDGTVYATVMAWPNKDSVTLTAFSPIADTYSGNVTSVKLLGHGDVDFELTDNGLVILMPASRLNDIAPVFAITTDGATVTIAERLDILARKVDNFLNSIESRLSYRNSGLYNLIVYNKIRRAIDDLNAGNTGTSEAELRVMFDSLNSLYEDFIANGVNKGGLYADITICREDVTKEHLVQAYNFSRADGRNRFGKPAHWTVENYNIPNGSDGIKQGLDRYSGQDALSLGIWNDRHANTEGDLANARIYRKVVLPRGLYFFGAAYNTTYNISDHAYMFVAENLTTTEELPGKALAFHRVAQCKESGTDHYGLWFFVEKEKELFLGWQADLAHGSDTQEFRATRVALLRIADCDLSDLTALQTQVDDFFNIYDEKGIPGSNSGQFPAEAVEEIKAYADKVAREASDADDELISLLYFSLSDQWDAFQASRNPGGKEDMSFGNDFTAAILGNATDFPLAAPMDGSRFGQPRDWTVENFLINRGSEGTKQGIDNYSGSNSLMLGIWDDRNNNSNGNLADARIYKKIMLDEGDYFFGASYNALYQMAKAYVFLNPAPIATDKVTSEAAAWADINEATIDSDLHGIYFTIPTQGEYCLGWQADLSTGANCQEFRAERIALMKKDSEGFYSPIEIETDTPDLSLPHEIYTLQGIKVAATTPGTIYLIRQNNRVFKLIAR